MIEKDVIIVGGGPAGAACAWKLAQAGIDFLMLDKSEFPRFKPCAGWVTPRVFRMLDVDPETYPFSLAHFSSFKVEIKQLAFRLKTNQYAIRRVEFDQWLLSRTSTKPWQHTVKSITRRNGKYLLDDQFACKYLVGAGGTNCPVRKYLTQDQPSKKAGTLIIAMEEEFTWQVSDPDCHLWFLQNGLPGYAWYVPKPGGILNIGVGGSAQSLKSGGDTLQRHWQLLIRKLDEKELVRGHDFQPTGHSYNLRGKAETPRVDNAFLAGDAIGLATLDMGEGIGPAIESGIRVADAICNGNPYTFSGIPKYSIPSLLGLRV